MSYMSFWGEGVSWEPSSKNIQLRYPNISVKSRNWFMITVKMSRVSLTNWENPRQDKDSLNKYLGSCKHKFKGWIFSWMSLNKLSLIFKTIWKSKFTLWDLNCKKEKIKSLRNRIWIEKLKTTWLIYIHSLKYENASQIGSGSSRAPWVQNFLNF